MRDLTKVKLTEVERVISYAINSGNLLHIQDFEEMKVKALKIVADEKICASEKYRHKFTEAIKGKNNMHNLLMYLSNVMLAGDGLHVIKL